MPFVGMLVPVGDILPANAGGAADSPTLCSVCNFPEDVIELRQPGDAASEPSHREPHGAPKPGPMFRIEGYTPEGEPILKSLPFEYYPLGTRGSPEEPLTPEPRADGLPEERPSPAQEPPASASPGGRRTELPPGWEFPFPPPPAYPPLAPQSPVTTPSPDYPPIESVAIGPVEPPTPTTVQRGAPSAEPEYPFPEPPPYPPGPLEPVPLRRLPRSRDRKAGRVGPRVQRIWLEEEVIKPRERLIEEELRTKELEAELKSFQTKRIRTLLPDEWDWIKWRVPVWKASGLAGYFTPPGISTVAATIEYQAQQDVLFYLAYLGVTTPQEHKDLDVVTFQELGVSWGMGVVGKIAKWLKARRLEKGTDYYEKYYELPQEFGGHARSDEMFEIGGERFGIRFMVSGTLSTTERTWRERNDLFQQEASKLCPDCSLENLNHFQRTVIERAVYSRAHVE